MITKQKALFYFVGDRSFKSLADAQKFDLAKLVPDCSPEFEVCNEPRVRADKIADWLLKNSVQIVDILTTTPTSRAKARKNNGATRKRRSITPAPVTTP